MQLPGCLVWWVGVAMALVVPAPPPAAPAAPGSPAVAVRPDAPERAVHSGRPDARGLALVVLRRWDAARAAAWASGDVAALRALYTPRSPVGRADTRLLQRYLDRGLRVRGLHTQVFSIQVLSRATHRLELRVVDRIVGGAAVGNGRCVPLPRDRAGRETITLRREEGRWLVADVR